MIADKQRISASVLTIAGSDSGGGAGIQADLLTFRDFRMHGCSAITALTAQNSVGVQRIVPTDPNHLDAQLRAVVEDMPPAAIKIGMLATAEIAERVCQFLQQQTVPKVLDPVLRSSTGAMLNMGDRKHLWALLGCVDLITPNRQEAEWLSQRPIRDAGELMSVASYLHERTGAGVLITGGHFQEDGGHADDYFFNGAQSFWLRSPRQATPHSHGSGCTLSAATAALLGRGMGVADSLVLAKMYVNQGLRLSYAMGQGAGTLARCGWPATLQDVPMLLRDPFSPVLTFGACDTQSLGLYPVVDHVNWLQPLLASGVRTIQLRIKNANEAELRQQILQAVELQRRYQARVFINDYWRLALECRAYGVHLGQEDLDTADLPLIAQSGCKLGTSNHAWYEIARSHSLRPSYMALGPVFATTTKTMAFDPLGLEQLSEWASLLKQGYPITAIGGIDGDNINSVLSTGVPSVAVVRAITQAADPIAATRHLLERVAQALPVGTNRSADPHLQSGVVEASCP